MGEPRPVAMAERWVVHKFGGTSVADADRYRAVARILAAEPGARKAVVVSAMSKVTDALIALCDQARARDERYRAGLEAVRARHLEAAAALLSPAAREPVLQAIQADVRDLADVLRGVFLSRGASERTVELVSGHGELWSARLLDAHLRELGVSSSWLDAREVLVVDPGERAVTVDWQASSARLRAFCDGLASDWLVITGFVASTPEGVPCTLKRNGSDFSASIFGKLLGAEAITIWTDVDGVLSADPRLVPEAVVLDEVSYHEATELAYFGAKVLHPSTMAPAIEDRIPIWIRNTFHPAHPGTRIHATARSARAVKGFAAIDGMALVNVEGTGMLGVPGIAHRLFGALREVGVSVVMISQASSEHSICFAIPEAQARLARETLERAFFAELHHGQIERIEVTEGSSILAAVGDNMVDHPGVAGRFFGALGQAGVNVRAIAQGSSERNVSAVIARVDSRKALRAVHAAFYLSHQTLSIGLIGPGSIGGTVLDQLAAQLAALREGFRIDLRVRGVMSSRRMVLADSTLALDGWRPALAEGDAPDLQRFVDHIRADHLPHAVVIDCTASAELTAHYPRWLARGLHIITPNKKANTAALADYRALNAAALAHGRHYLYETTVGAGLPIVNTLRDLVQTGDRVQRIEGVLSGTLSYIFNTWDGRRPFSAVVREAQERGYTEPDPRDDLSGMDVARKLVILARELGLPIGLDDVRVESLADQSDRELARRHDEARARGEVLRYVGVIDPALSPGERCHVALGRFPAGHAFAGLTGTDNIVAFHTARYRQPLIVRGPGAGPEVTAGGVFADLLRLASSLGGPP